MSSAVWGVEKEAPQQKKKRMTGVWRGRRGSYWGWFPCPKLIGSSGSRVSARGSGPWTLARSAGASCTLRLSGGKCPAPCFFWGVEHEEENVSESAPRRYKQVQYIAWLVEHACEHTPFVYQHIVRKAREEREEHARRGLVAPVSGSGGSGVGGNNKKPRCSCQQSQQQFGNPHILAAAATMRASEFEAGADKEGAEASGLCTVGDRAPFCIACINWVRRLSKSALGGVGGGGVGAVGGELGDTQIGKNHNSRKKKALIPLDNLILFIHDPGNHQVRGSHPKALPLVCKLTRTHTHTYRTPTRGLCTGSYKTCASSTLPRTADRAGPGLSGLGTSTRALRRTYFHRLVITLFKRSIWVQLKQTTTFFTRAFAGHHTLQAQVLSDISV